MYERLFSHWISWESRNCYVGDEPGVYVIAKSKRNIAGKPFSWRKEIVYVGMTNAPYGLKGRLAHFDATISGKANNHGGADRVRYAHQEYKLLSPQLYVAVALFKCDVLSKKPKDLITMGKVADFEYRCFAEFTKQFDRMPEFNDKRSKKFSRQDASRPAPAVPGGAAFAASTGSSR
jgi:hypothetical protein